MNQADLIEQAKALRAPKKPHPLTEAAKGMTCRVKIPQICQKKFYQIRFEDECGEPVPCCKGCFQRLAVLLHTSHWLYEDYMRTGVLRFYRKAIDSGLALQLLSSAHATEAEHAEHQSEQVASGNVGHWNWMRREGGNPHHQRSTDVVPSKG